VTGNATPRAPQPAPPPLFGSPALAALLASLPPPIVMFNKSHSGSRLTAHLLAKGGVFMGAHQRSTRDAWDMLPLVRYLVLRHYPDYRAALAGEDALLPDVIRAALERHLEGYDPASGRRWGWKLCETSFILPVVAACFPAAHFVHLVRDGRDVAFSNHTGPTDPFWKKLFFGTAAIDSWRGLPLTGRAYRRHPHLFNAQHWLASVTAGRTYGRALGDRYFELRYEALCGAPAAAAGRLFAFLGLGSPEGALASLGETVRVRRIGKFRRQPARKLREVLSVIGPLQAELGYPLADG
jgi:Sulfotransferase family